MSPRRRVEPQPAEGPPEPDRRQRSRLLMLSSVIAAAGLVTALVVSSMVFAHGETERRATIRDAAVLDFVRSFVAQYTSPDPFNANAYADKVLAQGTGNFAKLYKEKMNGVVIQVAQSEPGVGTVADLGIERWNDDGSASVIAVANMLTTMPDGKKISSASRWVVTAIREGEQWKVSNLIQVL